MKPFSSVVYVLRDQVSPGQIQSLCNHYKAMQKAVDTNEHNSWFINSKFRLEMKKIERFMESQSIMKL